MVNWAPSGGDVQCSFPVTRGLKGPSDSKMVNTYVTLDLQMSYACFTECLSFYLCCDIFASQ